MNRYNKLVAVVLFLGFLFRLGFIFTGPWDASDSIGYDRLAMNLSHGRGFSASPQAPFIPDIRRGPVYPCFLAGIYKIMGHHFFPVMVLQAALDCLGCLWVYWGLERIMSKRFTLVFLIMMAVYPFTAYYCATLLSETISLFLLSFSFFIWSYVIERDKEGKMNYSLLLFLGISLGLNALCKPALSFLPWIIVLTFFYPKTGKICLRKPVLIIIGFYIMVLPWTIRNYMSFDKFILVSPGLGQSLWLGSVERENLPALLQDDEDKRMDNVYEAFLGTNDGRKLIEYDQRLKNAALKNIKEKPVVFFKRIIFNSFRMWLSLYHYNMNSYLIYAARVVSWAVLVLAIIGIVLSCKFWGQLYPLLLIIFYFVIVHAPLHMEARYTIPARPYLLVFTAIGLFRLAGIKNYLKDEKG